MFKIGVDLGGSHIAVGLIDGKKILAKEERDFTDSDREDIESVIEENIVKYIEKVLDKNRLDINGIELIGIAAPGTHRDGTIIKAENLGIYNFDIVDRLNKHFPQTKISLNNDAKCAAMCEKTFGSLNESEDCIFMCLGTGIGGAVFMNGKLLKPKKITGFELRTCNNRKRWK